MTKKENRGFSIVEIVIAVAIFAIMMIPIGNAIISSLKDSSDAKELQYRNEFAENALEYVKSASMNELKNSATGGYFKENSPSSSTVTFNAVEDASKSYTSSLNAVTDTIQYDTYTIDGQVELGKNKTTYSYKVEIQNEDYAEHEVDKMDTTDPSNPTKVFIDPNDLELGIVEDIDYRKIALIDGTLANFDTAVESAFITKKLQILKNVDNVAYEQYMQNASGTDVFKNDEGTRVILVKLSKDAATQRNKVECILRYTDSNEHLKTVDTNGNSTTLYEEYVFYSETYSADDDLPNIYLMYNPFLYNSVYATYDYIVVDRSGLDSDVEVNLFIVETASEYGDSVKEVVADKDKQLVRYEMNTDKTTTKRNQVKVRLAAIPGADVTKSMDNLAVYHNFNQTNTNPMDYTMSASEPNVVTYLHKNISSDCQALTGTVESLDKANQESRGLYKVKIWIQEGDTVDTSISPVIEGTKGGSET